MKESLGDKELPLSQGKILGGSSAIHGLVYTPPSRATIDAWAKLGNPGWEWENFERSIEKSCTLTSTDGSSTGNGPLQVWLPDVVDNPWSKAWNAALDNMGFGRVETAFPGPKVGTVINADTVNPVSGQRSYAVSAYLDSARQRENLTLITGVMVKKILFEKNDYEEPIAIGVEYTQGDELRVALANKEVILSAGTFNSSRLLEQSGIGSSSRLNELGVDVVVENPFVGENLQCHSMCAVSFESIEASLDEFATNDKNTTLENRESLSRYEGTGLNVAAYLPFPGINTSDGVSDLENMIKHSSHHQTNVQPGIEAEPTISKAEKLFNDFHADFVHSLLRDKTGVSGYYVSSPSYIPLSGPPSPGDETYFSILLLLPHPLSRGSAHITSALASASTSHPDLAIDPRLLSHPLDIEVFARHLRQVETIIGSSPLASCIRKGGKRNPAASMVGGFNDLEAAKDYLRRTSVGAHHYTGTCSMMAKEYGGVVDEEMRVYGCRNLRVCDASIIPITPPANPQATVYGVAEHGASIIKSSI